MKKSSALGMLRREKGFTFIEVVTVVVIMMVLLAIAMPNYMEWRQRTAYRTTARGIANMLREGRSRSIMSNLQHAVEFSSPTTTQYRLIQGDSAVSIGTGVVAQSWVAIPAVVTVLTPSNVTSNRIEFSPNGMASNIAGAAATISIQDQAGHSKYAVSVSNIGRINIQ